MVYQQVDRHAPWLLMESHLDTVGVEGMIGDPFGARVEQGRLYGRGACDTKGSGAAMLWALRQYAAEGSGSNNVAILYTVDEEAHKAGDIDARDAAIEKARVAAEELAKTSPDLGEVARQAVEGNAARYAIEDKPTSSPVGGTLDDLSAIEDPRTDINIPPSTEKGDMESVANQLVALGLTKQDVYEIAQGYKPAPAGMKFKPWGTGCIGGAVRVTVKGKGNKNKHYLIKSDGISPLGLEAEEDTATLYRALGFGQPRVYRLRTKNDGEDIILMDWADQSVDVQNAQIFEAAFGDGTYYGYETPDLEALHLAPGSEEQVLAMLISNGVLGQTDRHPQNVMFGEDANGNGVIVFIDNGLMWWNGGYRNANDTSGRENSLRPWEANPLAIMMNVAPGRQHNDNQLLRAAREVINGMSREDAVSFITAWAERMRREAAARQAEFRNPGAVRWIQIRTQWLIDNAQDVADALRDGTVPDEYIPEHPNGDSWW